VDVWGPRVRWGPLIVASTREGPCMLGYVYVSFCFCVFFGSYETVAEQNWVSKEVRMHWNFLSLFLSFLMLSLRASQPHPSSCTAKNIIALHSLLSPLFLSLGIACGLLYI